MTEARFSLQLTIVATVLGTSSLALAQMQAPPPGPEPAPYGAAPAADPAPYGSMQAGGLAPPPPMTAPPAKSGAQDVEADLDKAKEEDAGRGLSWFYLEAEGGFEHVSLDTFQVDEGTYAAGLVETSASGPVIGAGAGVRLLFLTIGARARAGFFEPWQLLSLGGELGFHIPLGNLEPRFAVGAGYAGLGSLSGVIDGAEDALSVTGFEARASAGLDYYVTPVFSVGAGASFELLGLTRAKVDPATLSRIQQGDPSQAATTALLADGSSLGSALAITAVLGLHL